MQHFSPKKDACVSSSSRDKKLSESKEMKKKMYAVTRNANKRLKRRELLIAEQRKCIESQRKVIKTYERKIKAAELKVTELRVKINRISHRASYWRAKANTSGSKNEAKASELCKEVKTLKEKISSLDMYNSEMSETIESIMQSDTICTFEGGRYTDDVRACIYELLSLNVGVSKIAPVIRCVLKNISHKSVTRLPSHGLTCQMILESLTIVQAQLGDQLSQLGSCNTLQTDGTTKFGEHYGAYDVRVACADGMETYTLGLRHVFSGSAQDTLDTLKEILDDIDSVHNALGKEKASEKIVMALKNTMSDRHAAEKLFNVMLHDYRVKILPRMADNWNDLAEPEKEQLTRMNNFFCGLHFLVGLAEAAEETVKLWEARLKDVPTTSSGTQRLVRTACKAFHHKGSQQCGSSTLFRTYLRKEGIHKIPLAQFVGNRFNILFYDAAGVYFLRDYMKKFIETVHGTQANRLLQAVLADLKDHTYISGCRALGIIDKAVTGPLWRQLQCSTSSVLSMGTIYCEMKEKFDSWSMDAQPLLEGIAISNDVALLHVDDIWEALIHSNETDVMTQELLQLIFASFSITTKRLLLDHLPGGKHHSLSDSTMIEETRSVPTTNVAPERDFAVLDRLIREKPNASVVALESTILYSHNKTSVWLEKQSSEDRKKLLDAARMLAPVIRKKFNERRRVIEERRQKMILKRKEDIAHKKMRVTRENEMLTQEIEAVGLWKSKKDVDRGLQNISNKTEKIRILKIQIKFRQKVLVQPHPDSSVFKFSSHRKVHSLEKLKRNLCALLNEEEGHLPTPNEELTDILLQPELLVGRRIKHRFEADGNLVWYEGVVQQMNYISNEFQVAYDGEDDLCWFSLLIYVMVIYYYFDIIIIFLISHNSQH